MKVRIAGGNDGRQYAVFANEDQAKEAAESGKFDYDCWCCFGGYMNALRLKEIDRASKQQEQT